MTLQAISGDFAKVFNFTELKNFLIALSVFIRMFHNFTFFEIKNAWGLIRSDFGHNEEIKKNFFRLLAVLRASRPPKV